MRKHPPVPVHGRKLGQDRPDPGIHAQLRQQLFDTEGIVIVDQETQFFFRFVIQPGFQDKAFIESDMPDADLKILQSRRKKHGGGHGDDLRVRIHRALADQLRANLRIFLQSSSVLLMVDKGFSHIAKADRLSLLRIAAACSPRDRRRKVRSENERISFPVKELIQIPGRDGPDLIAENIKEFEGRRLNLPVPVGGKDMAQLPQQNLSLLTLLSIDIPYALRRVQYLLIHWIFLCNHSLRFIVVKR